MIHNKKYQIPSRTIIPFGQTHVIKIFIQYVKNIVRYMNDRGRNINFHIIAWRRDGLISKSDFCNFFSCISEM